MLPSLQRIKQIQEREIPYLGSNISINSGVRAEGRCDPLTPRIRITSPCMEPSRFMLTSSRAEKQCRAATRFLVETQQGTCPKEQAGRSVSALTLFDIYIDRVIGGVNLGKQELVEK